MVQVFRTENPQGRIAEMLGLSLGEGLGKGINTYYANKALDEVINDKSSPDQSISAKMGKLQSALAPYGEVGEKLFNQRMEIDKQELKEQEIKSKKSFGNNIYKNLLEAGYPEQTAKLWQQQVENSTTGGLTDVIKSVNDLLKRTDVGKGQEKKPENELTPTIEIPGIEQEKFPLDFPPSPEIRNRTPGESVKTEREREKINYPEYATTIDRLNTLDNEYKEVKYLKSLDDTPGALPDGLDWNVNWDTGDLRLKSKATPQMQAYVKTIARLARNAKEYFPGRVTNFDLEQFKAGFPTLANDRAGRQLIAEQLITANRIAFLREETQKAAMDHYGSNADPQFVKQQATKNYRVIKDQLEKKLADLNTKAQMYLQSKGGQVQGQPKSPGERQALGTILKGKIE